MLRLRGTNLKGDMVVSNTDFKLLLSNDVLFRPVRIIFPAVAINKNKDTLDKWCLTL